MSRHDGLWIIVHNEKKKVMMCWGLWRKNILTILTNSNMWSFRSTTLNKMLFRQAKWACIWNIGRIFYCICQNCYLLKFHFFGGLLTFKELEIQLYVRVFLPPTMEVANAKDLIITPYHGLKNLKSFLKIATNEIHHV